MAPKKKKEKENEEEAEGKNRSEVRGGKRKNTGDTGERRDSSPDSSPDGGSDVGTSGQRACATAPKHCSQSSGTPGGAPSNSHCSQSSGTRGIDVPAGVVTAGRPPKAFVDIGVLKLCDAFRFNPDQALRNRRPIAAVLQPISDRPDRDVILDELLALAREKRSDPSVDKPIAAWRAAIKKGACGYPAEKAAT